MNEKVWVENDAGDNGAVIAVMPARPGGYAVRAVHCWAPSIGGIPGLTINPVVFADGNGLFETFGRTGGSAAGNYSNALDLAPDDAEDEEYEIHTPPNQAVTFFYDTGTGQGGGSPTMQIYYREIGQ